MKKKKAIAEAVCSEIQQTATPIYEICKRHSIDYLTLYNWAKESENFSELLYEAQTDRAWRIMDEAEELIDSAPTYFEDSRGNRHESSAALNKIRSQVEHRYKMAETLSPEIFGDYRYQIKEINKGLAQMKKDIKELTYTANKKHNGSQHV